MRKIIAVSALFVFFICASNGYCLSLEGIKADLLKGDYKKVVSEGEKMLSGSGASRAELGEVHYLLGLGYLKDGNYASASGNFQEVLDNFKGSKFRDEAELGLGDSYALSGDIDKAQGYFKETISRGPKGKFRPQILYRLSQLSKKSGDIAQSEAYLAILRQEYPLSADLFFSKDIYAGVRMPVKDLVFVKPETVLKQPEPGAALQQPASIPAPLQPLAVPEQPEQPVVVPAPVQPDNMQKPGEEAQTFSKPQVPEIAAAPQEIRAALKPQGSLPLQANYSVQVGSFLSLDNANNLSQRLVDSGYAAYTEEVAAFGVKTFRVKVGRFSQRPDAARLAQILSGEGYPTKVTP